MRSTLLLAAHRRLRMSTPIFIAGALGFCTVFGILCGLVKAIFSINTTAPVDSGVGQEELERLEVVSPRLSRRV